MFCPNCGAERTGAFRFCMSCKFDYDTLSTTTAPAGSEAPPTPETDVARATDDTQQVSVQPVPAPPEWQAGPTIKPTKPQAAGAAGFWQRLSTKAKAAIVGVAAIVVLLAVGNALGSGDPEAGSSPAPTSVAAALDASPTPNPTPEPTPEATPTSEPTEEPEPTDEPTPDGPTRFKPGDVITVTSDDEPWAEVVVNGVDVVKKYDDEYFDDTPQVKGNRFIQAKISYTALQDGVDYNPFDWQVFANGEAVDNFAFVSNGPEPQLNSGTLPKGRKASGWVVYEVPAKGEVLLSYSSNMFLDEAPVFEVVLRSN